MSTSLMPLRSGAALCLAGSGEIGTLAGFGERDSGTVKLSSFEQEYGLPLRPPRRIRRNPRKGYVRRARHGALMISKTLSASQVLTSSA